MKSRSGQKEKFNMEHKKYQIYQVWDLPTRLFHWINFLSLLGLIAAGTVILWGGILGLTNDGKVLMKSIHVCIGYVFATNLGLRLIWAFVGNKHARWKSLLPFGPGYFTRLKSYFAATKPGRSQYFIGHNPLGQLAIGAILLALVAMAATGLVLAGTDIYFPPFGTLFQGWIAAPGIDPSQIIPNVKDNVDAAAYTEMRAFREPFILVHYWVFFILLGLAALHIIAVIHTEITSGVNLISAMFSGKKNLPDDPEDKE